MLFRQKIAPSCSYCRLGRSIGNGEVACVKRGITSCAGSCKRFLYDPLKREPEKLMDLNRQKKPMEFNEEDFLI
jgi:hypothetical protein